MGCPLPMLQRHSTVDVIVEQDMKNLDEIPQVKQKAKVISSK